MPSQPGTPERREHSRVENVRRRSLPQRGPCKPEKCGNSRECERYSPYDGNGERQIASDSQGLPRATHVARRRGDQRRRRARTSGSAGHVGLDSVRGEPPPYSLPAPCLEPPASAVCFPRCSDSRSVASSASSRLPSGLHRARGRSRASIENQLHVRSTLRANCRIRCGAVVSAALWFRHWIVACRGGFGQPPRLRLAEFVDHSIDTRLPLIAFVTTDSHRRTLSRHIPSHVS